MAKREKRLLNNDEITAEAIAFVKNEVGKYKDAHFFVTEKVAFDMRALIKRVRKNYWGVYDIPNDPITGKPKFWAPYTQLVVNAVWRGRDMDTKDGRFRAKQGRSGIIAAKQYRGWWRDWAHYNNFGETVNDTGLSLGIDGTAVWKTTSYKDKGKTKIKISQVDLLNCYLDPTSPSIQDAPSFTERALLSVPEIQSMDWMNTDDLKPTSNLHRSDSDLIHSFENKVYVDVYECWGLAPKRLITGKKSDKELVDVHIVVSGLEGSPVLHLVEMNDIKDKDGNIIKPYEEVRFIKVPGRWYGLGPAEMVLYIQEYINQILNNRLKKNTAAVLGLFKVKNNSGINQKVLSGLMSQGVIKVNNENDITNFEVKEAGQGSYQDEAMMKQWGFEITATQDISRGATMPSSASATASALQAQNAQTGATLDQENVGLFWQRWFNRHVLPHVPKMIKEQGVARLYADFEDIAADRERVVAHLAMEELDRAFQETGMVPSEQEVQQAMADAMRRLQEEGDMLVDSTQIDDHNVEAYFYASNEDIDAQLTVANLIQMMQIIPDAQRELAAEAMDLMGLNVPSSLLNARPTVNGTPATPNVASGAQQLTAAKTMSNGTDSSPRGATGNVPTGA